MKVKWNTHLLMGHPRRKMAHITKFIRFFKEGFLIFFFLKKEGSAGTTGPNITHEINTTKETNIERSRKQSQHKFSLER